MGKVKGARQSYNLRKTKASKSTAGVKGKSGVDAKPSTSRENKLARGKPSSRSLEKPLPSGVVARSTVGNKKKKDLKSDEERMKMKMRCKQEHERYLQRINVTKEVLADARKAEEEKKEEPPRNPFAGGVFAMFNSFLDRLFEGMDCDLEDEPRDASEVEEGNNEEAKDANK